MNTVLKVFSENKIPVKNGESEIKLAQIMGEMSEAKLRRIFAKLAAENIRLKASGQIRKTALEYALMRAFKENLDQIDQSIVNEAVKRAKKLHESLFGEKALTRKASAVNSAAKRRGRSSEVFPTLKGLLEDNPSLTREQFLEKAENMFPDKKQGTLLQYWYKACNELGIKTGGKRGRRSTGIMDRIRKEVKKAYDKNPDIRGKDLVEKLKKKFKETPATTVQVYTYKALKEVKNG